VCRDGAVIIFSEGDGVEDSVASGAFVENEREGVKSGDGV